MRQITKYLLLAGLLLLPIKVGANAVTLSSSICSTDPAVTLADPTDGTQTSSSLIVLDGQATSGYDLTVYNNSNVVAETTVGSDGNFSLSSPLTIGANNLYVHISLSGCGATVDSSLVTVTRLQPPAPPTPSGSNSSPGGSNSSPAASGAAPVSGSAGSITPLVQIKTPAGLGTVSMVGAKNGGSTVSSQVLLAGVAYPGARVTIYLNGTLLSWVTAASDGRYLMKVPLAFGDNIIRIVAPPLKDVVLHIRRTHDYSYVVWGAVASGALVLAFFGGHVLLHHRRNPEHPAYVKLRWQ